MASDVDDAANAGCAVCLFPPLGDFLPMLLTYESLRRTCAIRATAADLAEVVVGGSAGTRKSDGLIGSAPADGPQSAGKFVVCAEEIGGL